MTLCYQRNSPDLIIPSLGYIASYLIYQKKIISRHSQYLYPGTNVQWAYYSTVYRCNIMLDTKKLL